MTSIKNGNEAAYFPMPFTLSFRLIPLPLPDLDFQPAQHPLTARDGKQVADQRRDIQVGNAVVGKIPGLHPVGHNVQRDLALDRFVAAMHPECIHAMIPGNQDVIPVPAPAVEQDRELVEGHLGGMAVFPACRSVFVPLVIHIHGMHQHKIRVVHQPEHFGICIEVAVRIGVLHVKNAVVDIARALQAHAVGIQVKRRMVGIQLGYPAVCCRGIAAAMGARERKQVFTAAAPHGLVGINTVRMHRQAGQYGLIHRA